MNYLSVCSGIEAATVAWHPLGWTPWAFSEIEKFPSALLSHHYPNTPNLGDMTQYGSWPDANLDVLVGGTPCQSFSVAGLRKGLADPRGNLMLTYGAIAAKYRPRWLVWENVPGVLSSNGGRDFGTFLGMLAELGYGFAYRILDAQHFGVPQRRRRVFVVGHFGDWRRAAAVLFERHSLQGHPAPRREAGKTSPTIPSRSSAGGGLGTDFDLDGGLIRDVAGCLNSAGGHAVPGNSIQDVDQGYLQVVTPPLSLCLNAGGMGRQDWESETLIPTTGGGFDVAHAFMADDYKTGSFAEVQQAGPLTTTADRTRGAPVVAFAQNQRDEVRVMEVAGALAAEPGAKQQTYVATSAVRRLTPRECERLQGFPDDYTLIPVRGKPAADGPRYKALGNSMAVPVMRWIGERISAAESIAHQKVAA